MATLMEVYKNGTSDDSESAVDNSSTLETVAKNTAITARNSIMMNKNITKLVDISMRNRTGSFFESAKRRESDYESQFKTKSPTSVKKFMPSMPSMPSKSGMGNFLKMLASGILGAIALGNFLKNNPEVLENIKKIASEIFEKIKGALETSLFGEGGLFSVIKNLIKSALGEESYKSLVTGIDSTIESLKI